MTKKEFIHQYMLNLAMRSGTTVDVDIRDAIDAANQIEEKGYDFDERDESQRLADAIDIGMNNAQKAGGFCIQFNQDYPMLHKAVEPVEVCNTVNILED